MILKCVDILKHSALSAHLEVKRLKRFRFRGVHISHQVRKARQRPFPREVKARSPPSSPAHHLLPVSHRGLHTEDLQRWRRQPRVLLDRCCPFSLIFALINYRKKAVVFPKSTFTPWTRCVPSLPSGRKYKTIKIKTNMKTQLPPWAVGAITWQAHKADIWNCDNLEEWELYCAVFTRFTFHLFLSWFYSFCDYFIYKGMCDACPGNTGGAKLLFTVYLEQWRINIYFMLHFIFY